MRTPVILMVLAPVLSGFFVSCHGNGDDYDASGTFEADEVIISSEAGGTIQALNIEEGQVLQVGDTVGYIDTVQLHLKKKQLEAQAMAVLGRKPDVAVQLAVLQEQLEQARREQQRVKDLYDADAATRKQLDDATTQIAVIERQIKAQKSSLDINTTTINREALPLLVQIEQVNDQIERSILVNKVAGTVLVKYAEAFEMASPGKPLYKIADLSTIVLRAYITGTQFAETKLDQKVRVRVDGDPEKENREYEGVIEWISSKAEFTPKTIQTRDERANLVYAVRIRVVNDGYLKIGMYGDVKF